MRRSCLWQKILLSSLKAGRYAPQLASDGNSSPTNKLFRLKVWFSVPQLLPA